MDKTSYMSDQELPDLALDWYDGSGDVIPFSSAYTFTVKLVRTSDPAQATVLTKTTGITGADVLPNYVIGWSVSDWAALTLDPLGSDFFVYAYARRTADSKDRCFNPKNPPVITVIPAPA